MPCTQSAEYRGKERIAPDRQSGCITKISGDPFAKFHASALFTESRKFHEPGWTTQDRVADSKFGSLPADRTKSPDLRLQPGSPAVNTGVPVPAEWPDPLRAADKDAPDIGALPLGAPAWGVGVDGRIPLFGGVAAKR